MWNMTGKPFNREWKVVGGDARGETHLLTHTIYIEGNPKNSGALGPRPLGVGVACY